DLDHPDAVLLADSFLPHTDGVFGRGGKPRSHWLYMITAPVKTAKFKSACGAMIVELRSTGCQTVWPGSTHPSGEAVRWDQIGTPVGGGEIAESDAVAALTDAAAACGLPAGEAVKTIQSGLTAGMASPRSAPQVAVRHNPQNPRGSRGCVGVRGHSTAFRTFPLPALPEVLRRFVAAASKAIGCDPSYIALPALGGAAGAIGNTRRVQL